MASDDCQETFEALPPSFDDLVGKSVGKNLARERGDIHAGRFAFENIAECFEIGVTSADNRVTKFKSGDISLYGCCGCSQTELST